MRPPSLMAKKIQTCTNTESMNTRVNIYIFTQICNHIYFPPDLVQQSHLSEKLMVVTIINREITKKSFKSVA